MIGHDDQVTSSGISVPALLARTAVEGWVAQGIISVPDDVPVWLQEAARGVFVCLKISGELRGCVGTVAPSHDLLYQEIMHNAVSAATADPRFRVVTAAELPRLSYSVDILGEPEEVAGPEHLDPKNYGVIVTSAGRRGLLLPDIEGVSEPLVQLQIACQKAGIFPGENYSISRFKVDRYN